MSCRRYSQGIDNEQKNRTLDDRPPDLGEMSLAEIGLAVKSQLLAPRTSQSFGRGWLSVATPVLARALFSLMSISLVMLGSVVRQIRGIPIGGETSSTAVAIFLGAAELGWINHQLELFRLGFHFQGVLGLQLHFWSACYLVQLSLVSNARASVHTWVDVQVRVIQQHVAVNIKNPNRSWVYNLGPQQKSTFLPWTGVLEGGLVSTQGVILGHFARTKMWGLPGQFGVARLLEDVVKLVYIVVSCVCYPGPGYIPCRAAVLPRFVAKPCEHRFLSKSRMRLDDKKDQRQKASSCGQ